MLSNFFNSSPIIPTVKASAQANAFAKGDVVFDWVSFDIPRGPARLLGATISIRSNKVANTVAPLNLIFAKDDGTNTTPATMGTEHELFGLSNFNRTDIIGFLPGALADMTGGGITAVAARYQTTATPAPGLVLESSPNSGNTTGTDRFYVGGLAGGLLDLTSGVLINETDFGIGEQTSITVDGTTTNNTVFAPGDVIHAHGSSTTDAALGTISALQTSPSPFILLTAPNIAAADEDDAIFNINPIRIILHFEK